MKRVLSWIVMFFISEIVGVLTYFVLSITGYVLLLIDELNKLLQVLIYMIGGFALLSFIFWPVHYGAAFCVVATESIHNSKKGLRYIIFPICIFMLMLVQLIKHGFSIHLLIMSIYYIALMATGLSEVSNRDNTY